MNTPRIAPQGLVYDKVRERVYEVHRESLFGLIQWDEIVHIDRLSSDTRMDVICQSKPDRYFVNGIEYKPV